MNVSVSIQSESKEKSIILREMDFEGDLSEEQRARLFEIANKCPIHNLLESQITIDSKLKE
jgi:putative redox protein